ncbi:MAG: hypothetical protein QW797_06215 [Thermoproteota archaeon]
MFRRILLTILVWGLILEILTFIYLSNMTWRFEFAYNLFLLVITSIALLILVLQMRSEYRRAGSSKD